MINFNEIGIKSGIEGDKLSIQDILNREIVITDFKVSGSNYKTENCTTIQFYFPEDEAQVKHIIFTGSAVLKDMLKKCQKYCDENNENFEIKTKIVQVGKFYSLT